MKHLVLVSLILVIVGMLTPMIFMGGQAEAEPEQSVLPPTDNGDTYHAEKDSKTKITVSLYGETKERSMAEQLSLVLAAEVPASFEEEALKAQAVAVRTYILYCGEHRKSVHPDADICCESNCCIAYRDETELRAAWGGDYENNMAIIRKAIEATDGQVLVFDGEPILAAFHSSSAGQTEEGSELWGDISYLKSVSSPENSDDVPNFVTTVEVSADNFRETIISYFPETKLEGDASAWAADLQLDDSGRVRSVRIGDRAIYGADMRKMFQLRSTAFELKYTEGIFVFTVTGYGHGLGMSQYGANVMARKGFTYTEILKHYYTGVELT